MNKRISCLVVWMLLVLVPGMAAAGTPAEDRATFQEFKTLMNDFSRAEQIDAWKAFIQKYPDNRYIGEAKKILADLQNPNASAPKRRRQPAGTDLASDDPDLDFLTDPDEPYQGSSASSAPTEPEPEVASLDVGEPEFPDVEADTSSFEPAADTGSGADPFLAPAPQTEAQPEKKNKKKLGLPKLSFLKKRKEAKKQKEREKAEAELARMREQAEQERVAQEQAERQRKQQLARQRAELERQERLAREKAERERQQRLAREKAERERQEQLARQQAERERQEQLAREKAERARQEQLARQKAERERQERVAAERKLRQMHEAKRLAAAKKQQESDPLDDILGPAENESTESSSQAASAADEDVDPFLIDPANADEELARREKQAERDRRKAERELARMRRKQEREKESNDRDLLARADTPRRPVTPDTLGTTRSSATFSRNERAVRLEVAPYAGVAPGEQYIRHGIFGAQAGVHIGRYVVLEGEAAAFTGAETELLGQLREIDAQPEILSTHNYLVGGGVAFNLISGGNELLGASLRNDFFVRAGGGILNTDLEICYEDNGVSCAEPVFIDGANFVTLNAGIGHRFYFTRWLAVRSDVRYRTILELIDGQTRPRNNFQLNLGVSAVF